jgi:integrase
MLKQKEIENLKAGPARQEIPDGGGLYFILQTSGAGSWALRYRFDGKPRKLTLGPWPAVKIKAARDKAREAQVAIAAGRDPGAEKVAERIMARNERRAEDHDYLVENVVEAFIATYASRNLRASTAAEVKRILRKEIAGPWRGRRLSEIKAPDVHKVLDAIVARGAPYAANRVLTWFKTLCKWAESREIIEASPCAKISTPAKEASRDRVLNDGELAAVWKAADQVGYPYGDAVKFLILTGQRRSEVTDLEWREIDLNAATWTLPADRAKNKREHVTPLSETAIDLLRSLPRIGEKYVFTFSGDKPLVGFDIIKKRIEAALPDAVAPWRLHDLRRSFASGLARLGVAVHVTERLLNHVSGTHGGIVGVYQRFDYEKEQRSAVEAWAGHVDALTR